MPNGHYAVDSQATGGSNSFSRSDNFGADDDVVQVAANGTQRGLYTYTSTTSTAPSSTSTANYWGSPIVADATTPYDPASATVVDDSEGPELTWNGTGGDQNGLSYQNDPQPVRTDIYRDDGVSNVKVGSQAGGF